jgi:hypothetical protein
VARTSCYYHYRTVPSLVLVAFYQIPSNQPSPVKTSSTKITNPHGYQNLGLPRYAVWRRPIHFPRGKQLHGHRLGAARRSEPEPRRPATAAAKRARDDGASSSSCVMMVPTPSGPRPMAVSVTYGTRHRDPDHLSHCFDSLYFRQQHCAEEDLSSYFLHGLLLLLGLASYLIPSI